MVRVLYPGSFDPITKGHMNIIDQASNIFDEVVVVVMQNPFKKNGMFTLEERFEMIEELYKKINKVKVIIGSGAVVDVALLNECNVIVRGLRSLTDYAEEVQQQQINKRISDNKVNTIFLAADPEYQFISSSATKAVFELGKDISDYVDDSVKEKMLVKRGKIYE